MNTNPILPREIGTRRDKQYKVGERELIRIIKNDNLLSQFEPLSTNLIAALKKNENAVIFSLN